jgi:hypothetical protein
MDRVSASPALVLGAVDRATKVVVMGLEDFHCGGNLTAAHDVIAPPTAQR